jgi:glycosyltransferase involved in cell wall biosynthesis
MLAVCQFDRSHSDLNEDTDQVNFDIDVSVVMPCLNEAETVGQCIGIAMVAIKSCGINGEIVIADNGSTDGSQDIARAAGARVINVEDKGYGNALRGGIRAARGTFVLMGDADGSYDFGELPRFLERIRAGNDLVMGCRLPSGGGHIEAGAMPWKHRWIGNPILSGLGRLFFRAPVRDFHCGLRAFSRDAILNLNLCCSGMEFASEMLVKAVIAGLQVDEISITLRPDGRSRRPHLRSWRDGWRHLRFLLLFSPQWLFFNPGLLMFVLGVAGFLALLSGPVALGGITFDTNTMLLCSTSMIIGFQALFFAVFTKAFAIREKLLRPDKRIEWLLRANTIEWGVLAGGILFLGGVALFVIAFLKWKATGFGPLSYPDSLRIVIPAITAMAVGVQCFFAGFALALFDLAKD